MELAIPLFESREPLFRQVYAGLRKAILSGSLPAGERLPSTRDLAEQLGISRTVVVLAYDHLLAEGFLEGRRGSGTYVSSSLNRSTVGRPKKLSSLPLSRFGIAVGEAAHKLDFPNRPPSRLRCSAMWSCLNRSHRRSRRPNGWQTSTRPFWNNKHSRNSSHGLYERHLRRLGRRNAERREALLNAIHDYLSGRVELSGDG
jgi:DNA-binding transcriptional MocR family regulator